MLPLFVCVFVKWFRASNVPRLVWQFAHCAIIYNSFLVSLCYNAFNPATGSFEITGTDTMKNRRLALRTQKVGGVLASLSLLLGLSATVRADVPNAPAKPGEILVMVGASMTRAQVDAMADGVGCVVVRPLQFSPNYFLLRQKGVQATKLVNGRTDYVPDAGLKAAVESLRSKGVVADPNYIAEKLGNAPAKQRTAQTADSPVKLRKTRATEPPSNETFLPDDPYFTRGSMWGMEMIRMPEAWAVQTSILTAPVVVEVIDTGMDRSHPDIGPNVLDTSMNFTDDTANTNIRDQDAHGTHVAGTVAGLTNNGIGVPGVAGYTGGGVNVKIMTAKVLDTSASAGTRANTLEAIVEAIDYGTQQKVDVMNMSLGVGGLDKALVSDFPQSVVSAFNRAFAAGVTICVSAGNSQNFGTAFPADIPGAIKVSALNRQGTLAIYSSSGGSTAIAAPGGTGISQGDDDAIWSTWPTYTGTIDGPTFTNYYSINGTSMACPHVSGVAALIVASGAVVPHTAGNNLIVKNIIQTSAAAIEGDVPNFGGNNKYGAGRMDAYSAILPYSNPPFIVNVPGTSPASVQQGVTTPNIAQQVGDLPYNDRGTSYSATQAPLTIAVRGVARKLATDSVTVELQTATTPSTTLRTFVAGDTSASGFDIPTLATGQSKGTLFNIQVPRNPAASPIPVPDGRYRFVVKLNGEPQAYTFFEKVSRSQPVGRALFSTPFQVRQVDSNTPEQTLFGAGTTFSLARYNPLRLPSDFDYALFQSGSGGRNDVAARFGASALNGLPLSFDTSNPSVSVAPVGLGYWLKLDSAVVLNSGGTVVTNPVGVRCYAANGGWNMIGAPFTFPVAWGGTTVVGSNGQTYSLTDAITAGIVSSALVSFVNNDYQYDIAPGGTLQPFNGYWVRVFQDCTLIIAPSGSNGAISRATGAKVPVATAALSPLASGWKVRLAATVDGDRDGQNFFGQVKSSASKTRLTLPKPPSGAGHAYVRFVDTETGGRATAKTGTVNNGPMAYDLRTATSGNEGSSRESWTAQVSTDRPDSDVVLTWDGLGTAPRRAGLFLTDTVTGRKVSLRDRSSYTYKSGAAGSTRSFTITMEPTQTSGPLAIRNVTVAPIGRAMGGGVAVRFSTTRDGDVTGVVRTLSGQVVSVLGGTSRATAATTTQMVWTGRAQNGSALPAGAYQLEIAVRDADGNTATIKQTVQSAR